MPRPSATPLSGPTSSPCPPPDTYEEPSPQCPDPDRAGTTGPDPRPAVTLAFTLGELSATPEALTAAHAAGTHIVALVLRHLGGDWGDAEPSQAAANDQSVADGGPLRSTYRIAGGADAVIVTTDAARTGTVARLASQPETGDRWD